MTRWPLPAMNQHGTIERQWTQKRRYATRKQAYNDPVLFANAVAHLRPQGK